MEDYAWTPDEEIDKISAEYTQKLLDQMAVTVGYMGVNLESRDEIMRRYESNFGNFIADLMRTEFDTDFALANSGSFRKNSVIQAGPFNLMMVWESFPFNDLSIVLEMSGHTFKKALEHAISKWPSEDGCFPQVSNLQFIFDPEKPDGHRIELFDIYAIGDGEFELNNRYKVAIPKFIANGGDGYDMFHNEDVKVIVDEENGMWIIDIVK